MDSNPTADPTIAQVVGTLHQEGVQKGQEEAKRIIDEAERQAKQIIDEAERQAKESEAASKTAYAEKMQRAKDEISQLLLAACQEIPASVKEHAEKFLEQMAQHVLTPESDSATVQAISEIITESDNAKQASQRLKQILAVMQPQSFIQGLMVISAIYYATQNGVAHLVIDHHLENHLNTLIQRLVEQEKVISYEFKPGLVGFIISDNGLGQRPTVTINSETVMSLLRSWMSSSLSRIFDEMKNSEV